MKKMREINDFLAHRQTPGTFNEILQKFLSKRHRKGLSDYSVIHLHNSLHPMGVELKNPPIATLTPQKVRGYVDHLWLRYAPGTMRPIIGDLKQFFGWCKKKGYTSKNLGSRLTHSLRPRRLRLSVVKSLGIRVIKPRPPVLSIIIVVIVTEKFYILARHRNHTGVIESAY